MPKKEINTKDQNSLLHSTAKHPDPAKTAGAHESCMMLGVVCQLVTVTHPIAHGPSHRPSYLHRTKIAEGRRQGWVTLTQLSSWGTSLNHLLAPGFTPFRIVSFYLRPPTSDQRLCLKDDDPIIINIGAGRDPTPTAQPGNSLCQCIVLGLLF